MRPEDKSAADNQMGRKSVGSMTDEDASGLPQGAGAEPGDKGYTDAPNAATTPINKSRGTGVQINNGALDAGQAAGGDGNASAIAKVTSVSGDKVPGMNYGPSIGRFDNPPPVIKQTGTPESVDVAMKALPDRFPGTDTEHRHPHPKDNDGTSTGLDRIWR